jgi:flagellar hook-length control protein FliK
MSIEQFYTSHTSITAPKGINAKGAGSALQGGGSDMLGFFDLFLQNALSALEAQKTKAEGQDASSTITVEMKSAEQTPEITDALAAALNALEAGANDNDSLTEGELDAIVQTALAELPEEDNVIIKDILKNAFLIADEKSMRPALNNLQRALQKLENLMAEDETGQALIMANITPEQITELKVVVDNILAGKANAESIEDNAEKFASVLSGLVSILPPKTKDEFVASSKNFFLNSQKGEEKSLIGLKEIQAQLNALIGGPDGVKKGTALDVPVQGQIADGNADADAPDFDDVLKQFLNDTKSVKDGKMSLAESMAASKASSQNTNAEGAKAAAILGVIKNMASSMGGSMTSPAEFSSSNLNEMGLPLAHAPIQSANAMTALVTQAQHASTPHPATQMVAASIKKLAGNGESKEITLKLDPPELGRVEVKMSFGKDSAVKAVLIAEKPETFMMLQRDAQLLERALQDAGLEAGENALSFELSQDGQGFSQDGRHDGSRNKSGAGNESKGDGQETVIETTMNWHVDPSTGHMRYNILA